MEGGGNRYLLGRECKKEDGGADSLIFSDMDAFHDKDMDAQVFDKLGNLKEAQMKNPEGSQSGGEAKGAAGLARRRRRGFFQSSD